MHRFLPRRLGLICVISLLLEVNIYADPVPVRHPQGSAHGFVALRTLEETLIATGDMTQSVRGDFVTSRLLFRFRDGSIDDDTTVFSQRGVFRLISDHHIQRGPSFTKPIDVLIEALTGQITSHTRDGKIKQDHLNLPLDVSNGLPPNLLMNLLPSTPETKLAFVAPTAKPRLIHVSIKPAGEVPFTIGGTKRKAIDYILHVELVASRGPLRLSSANSLATTIFGFLGGASPAFIREEGALYEGGPVWRIEQISPTFSTN